MSGLDQARVHPERTRNAAKPQSFVAILIVVLVAIASGGIVGIVGIAGPAGADADATSQFFSRIASLRSSKGLGALTSDRELTSAADRWTDHLTSQRSLSHNPNLSHEVTFTWTLIGENVGDGGSVESIWDAFVASPPHYENLTDSRYNRVGIGTAFDVDGLLYVTTDFAAASSDTTTQAPGVTAPRTTAPPRVSHPSTTRSPGTTRTKAAAPASNSVGGGPGPTRSASGRRAVEGPASRMVASLSLVLRFNPGG